MGSYKIIRLSDSAIMEYIHNRFVMVFYVNRQNLIWKKIIELGKTYPAL